MRHGRPMTLDFARLLSGPWLVKYMVPRHEGHYVLYPEFVPWISRAALRFRRLDLPMRREHAGGDFRSLVNLWPSISQPRLRYTLGRPRRNGRDLRFLTIPEKALY